MQFIKISFIIILVTYIILLLYFSYKNGKMLKTLLLSALSGIFTFAAVNILSHFTGVGIPVNGWTTSVSSVFGIPGVLGLLVLRLFF